MHWWKGGKIKNRGKKSVIFGGFFVYFGFTLMTRIFWQSIQCNAGPFHRIFFEHHCPCTSEMYIPQSIRTRFRAGRARQSSQQCSWRHAELKQASSACRKGERKPPDGGRRVCWLAWVRAEEKVRYSLSLWRARRQPFQRCPGERIDAARGFGRRAFALSCHCVLLRRACEWRIVRIPGVAVAREANALRGDARACHLWKRGWRA